MLTFVSNMAEHESDNDADDSSNMMELFASYYGISSEDHQSGIRNASKSQINVTPASIDSSNFNPVVHVERMLENMRAEELLDTDVSLTHDIRSLDSDMQMLVYENYNKFIAATETIKRMKTNVEAMSVDMNSVKSKMDLISSHSTTLDASLAAKNGRVEKLVRVQRLLKRLEFLTELPERLTEMIDRKEYNAAVQLYRRTNHVLTRYGHVLSFKNIQQSADNMMASLCSRIMDGLDDPELDSTQVTRFVSILINMNAPRERVADKMLNAHRHRSLRIVKLFSASISSSMGSVTAMQQDTSLPASSGSSGVAKVRQFHQILVVGLIEACKGLMELYGETMSEKAANQGQSPIKDSAQARLPDANKVAASLTALRSLATSMMAEVSKCLTTVMRAFFDGYNSYVVAHQELDPSNPKIHTSQLRFYELDDEKQAWIVFAQQAIAEAVFLDKALTDCTSRISNVFPGVVGASPLQSSSSSAAALGPNSRLSTPTSSNKRGKEESMSHAFAREVMSVLSDHVLQSFVRRLLGFSRSFHALCEREVRTVGAIALLVQGDPSSQAGKPTGGNPFDDDNSGNSRGRDSLGSGGAALGTSPGSVIAIDSAARAQLAKLATTLPGKLETLEDEFYGTFAELTADAQQIVDVAASLPPELSDLCDVCRSASSCGNQTQIAGARLSNRQPATLPLLFCQKAVQLFYDSTLGSTRDDVMRRKECVDIFTEGWPAAAVTSTSGTWTQRVSPPAIENEVGSSFSCLLAAAFLMRISSTAAPRLLRELNTSSVSNGSRITSQTFPEGGEAVSGRLVEPDVQRTSAQICKLLSEASVSLRLACAERVAQEASAALLRRVTSLRVPGGNNAPESVNDGVRVSSDAIEAARLMGMLVTIACTVLSDPLPAAMTKLMSHQEAAVPGFASRERLVIDRLFTQSVQVYPGLSSNVGSGGGAARFLAHAVSASSGGSDDITCSSAVPGTVAKAILKNLLETVRLRVLHTDLYSQVSMDVAYLKLVFSALLGTGKVAAEVSVLLEQVASTLRERYFIS